jgi:hypothetical protein
MSSFIIRGHSRLGYYFWVSNGKMTFLDNVTCLVCFDLYCEAYFGSYLHFILHIEYTDNYRWSNIMSTLHRQEATLTLTMSIYFVPSIDGHDLIKLVFISKLSTSFTSIVPKNEKFMGVHIIYPML